MEQPKQTSASYSFTEGTFGLQVFPSPVWLTVPIQIPWSRYGPSRNGTIAISTLYEYTQQVILEASGLPGLPSRGITYDVNVLDASVGTTTARLEDLDDLSRSRYNAYINKKHGPKLRELLNNPATRNSTYPVTVSDFEGSRVLIFPAPRDMAHLLYEMPALPVSLGYEISIYRDLDEEYEEVVAYTKDVISDNRGLSPLSLSLAVPMEAWQFSDTSRIIFIARDTSDGRMIGYCGCTVIPYRVEISALIESSIETALERFSPFSEEEDDEDEETKVLLRYLMGVRPGNVLEIEGLSVSSRESSRKIGLALLYQALYFIVHPAVQGLYPVSHIASQAASYLTKRYLLRDFKFRYHGGNNFMNETFVETLSEENKRMLGRVIYDLIGYYNAFFESNAKTSLHQLLSGPGLLPVAVGEMFTNVVSLYQLYYLLLRASRPRGYDPYNQQGLLARFATLFGSLSMALRSGSDLVAYFTKARENVLAYSQDRNKLVSIGSSILVPDKGQLRPGWPLYGFMALPAKKLQGTKTPYAEGYDVVYAAVPNIVAISREIGFGAVDDIAHHVLKDINLIVSADVALRYDYELAVPQLDRILALLRMIIKSGLMPRERETLQEMVHAIEVKQKLLNMNVEFNAYFTSTLYYVDERHTGGFDTFISFAALEAKWPDIQKAVLTQLSPQRPPVMAIDEEEEAILPGVLADKVIPIPSSRDALDTEIVILFNLLMLNYDATLPIRYNGETYSLLQLASHYNTLRNVARTQGPLIEILTSDEEGSMDVEEQAAGAVVVYDIEDFIEEEDEALDLGGEENVLNKLPI